MKIPSSHKGPTRINTSKTHTTVSRYPQLPDRLFLSDPHVVTGSGLVFTVEKPFRFFSTGAGTITVPAGFITDGYSIPRIFWGLLQPYGQPIEAAVVHDFLYSRAGGKSYPQLTRKQIDRIFLECMELTKVPRGKRFLIYRAVRLGGWKAFRNS